MKLGSYVEICVFAPDLAEAVAFYEKLGFKKLADDVVTDDCNNIRLLTDEHAVPRIAYYGSDLSAIKDAGIALSDHNSVTNPKGVDIVCHSEAAPHPMPAGEVIQRTPRSQLGKFGEYTIYTDDLQKQIDFWTKLGFNVMYQSAEPYPWGIVTDGLIVVGLHAPTDTPDENQHGHAGIDIHLTYFAKDMPERIKQVQAMGIAIQPIVPLGENGEVVNAEMTAPGGQGFYLFTGEI